ncbi:MAG: ATPase domain-containing protein [Ignisphaera sp.]
MARRDVVTTGSEELDSRLGGGIPVPSLLLVEGDHGTGKSVVVQQIAYGALKSGLRVYYITTESTVRELLLQAKRVSFDMTNYFLKGFLKIFPVHMEGARWAKNIAKLLLQIVGNFMVKTMSDWDLFIVDSFSVLAVYASTSTVLDFLTIAKNVVSQDKLVILSVHPGVLSEEIMIRARSVCDGYIRLRAMEIGGMMIKAMEVVKLRGALGPVDSLIAFDVDPAFGIKVLPLSLAKA